MKVYFALGVTGDVFVSGTGKESDYEKNLEDSGYCGDRVHVCLHDHCCMSDICAGYLPLCFELFSDLV